MQAVYAACRPAPGGGREGCAGASTEGSPRGPLARLAWGGDGVRSAVVTACLLLAAASLCSPAGAAGSLVDAAAVQPPFHGPAPNGSDIVFSTRFKRPAALSVIDASGATRVEWVCTADRAYVAQLKQRAQWFGATLNANPRLPGDAGYVCNFDGQVLAAPWMQGWNVFWASSAHPDAQGASADKRRAALVSGANSIQFDDPPLQAFAALN